MDATPTCDHAQLPGSTECLCCRLNQIEDDAARWRWLNERVRTRIEWTYGMSGVRVDLGFWAPSPSHEQRSQLYTLQDAVDVAMAAEDPRKGGAA